MSRLSELAEEDVRDAAARDADTHHNYHGNEERISFKFFNIANSNEVIPWKMKGG